MPFFLPNAAFQFDSLAAPRHLFADAKTPTPRNLCSIKLSASSNMSEYSRRIQSRSALDLLREEEEECLK
jgi:hypothetical protein